MTAAQQDEASRRSELYGLIVRHLILDPLAIGRLDIGLLLDNPNFWDDIEAFEHAIATRLKLYNPNYITWQTLKPGLKAYVLGDRTGVVIAFAKAGKPDEHTAYLLVLPTGLDFHVSLTREQIEIAEATSNQDEVTAVRALEDELKLFDFMVGHVAATCDVSDQDERLLAEIRQILWELKAFSWAPTERFMQMARVQALFTAIAKNSGYQLEDIMSDSRRAYRLS